MLQDTVILRNFPDQTDKNHTISFIYGKADISILLTHRLVLYALEAGECVFCVQIEHGLVVNYNYQKSMLENTLCILL